MDNYPDDFRDTYHPLILAIYRQIVQERPEVRDSLYKYCITYLGDKLGAFPD